MTKAALIAGLCLLAFAWFGPVGRLSAHSFAAHMSLHMLVVAIAAPLVAIGIGPRVVRWRWAQPVLAAPLLASLADFLVIWAWHAPALHLAARTNGWVFMLEQGSFLGVGLLVWVSALASEPGSERLTAFKGALSLLFTSMHMTLLGAIIGLATRPIYAHGHGHLPYGLSPLNDQQLGGVIMLAVGGAVYLAGGIALMGRVLRRSEAGGRAA
jgi:putative membrane protein